MLKRPIFAIAVALAAAIAVLLRFYPSAVKPVFSFSENEKILLTGDVYKIENKTNSIYVYLKNAYVSNDADLISGADAEPELKRKGQSAKRALLVLQEEELCNLVKIGNTLFSVCEFQKFDKARNYGNFEEETYYNSCGVYLLAKSFETTITNKKTDYFRQFLNDTREKMVQVIYEAVEDEDTAGILAAICTGDRSGLSDSSSQLYRQSGIAHILAVSGLHISMIGMTIFRLLRKKFRYPLSAIVSLFLMIGFCIMSSASPSAVRATIMFAVQIAAIGLGKTYDILSALSLAAILLLLSNPFYLYHTGFQFSFAAILGVAVLYQTFEKFFIIKNRFFSAVMMSIAVTMSTIPLTAFYYYEIPLYSILLNLIVLPVMSLVLGTGLAAAFFGMISVLLGRFFSGAGAYIVVFIKWICEIIGKLPASRIVTGCPEKYKILIYYCILLLMVFVMNQTAHMRKKQPDKKQAVLLGNKKSKTKTSNLWRWILFICFCTSSLMILFLRLKNEKLNIVMIDVGQGECILLEHENGSAILIDGGSTSINNAAKYVISGALKYRGIQKIDCLIITHPDTDHISGIMEILEKKNTILDYGLELKQIMTPDFSGNTNYESLKEMAEEKEVRFSSVYKGMNLEDGILRLSCLYPPQSYSAEDSNEYSAVLKLEYGAFSALFTGDLGADGEQNLLKDLQVQNLSGYDLLKVAHHGSRYSSSESFLSAVSPKISIISAGVGNQYGHPHKETLERLEKAGSEVFCTADFGELIISVNTEGTMLLETKLSG